MGIKKKKEKVLFHLFKLIFLQLYDFTEVCL